MAEFGRLAIDGGAPVRKDFLPYARQSIDEDDIVRVVETLRSDWLTTGPTVEEFERAFASAVGSRHAIAVSSGTAALHAAVFASGIGPGDEVIVPALTFVATANCVIFQGATPVFADVDPTTLLLDVDSAARMLTERTRAVIAVDYAGQPCDYDLLREAFQQQRTTIIADACHALGAFVGNRAIGSIADLSTFSFHPAKHITTAEGGMVTTDDEDSAQRMRVFRNHGITTDHRERARRGAPSYEMVDVGFNYRLSDLQCALGLSQLQRLPRFVERRREIARRYDAHFADLPGVEPLARRPGIDHAYHLYVVRFLFPMLAERRDEIVRALHAEGIGTAVHYPSTHLHPFYRRRFDLRPGLCPHAERAAEEILSLPMHPSMGDDDVDDVITALGKVTSHFGSA
jgi:perosamine synthetase